MRVDRLQGRAGEQRPGPDPRGLVGCGHAHDRITLLEGVGVAQEPGMERRIPAPRQPLHVRDEILGDEGGCRRIGPACQG